MQKQYKIVATTCPVVPGAIWLGNYNQGRYYDNNFISITMTPHRSIMVGGVRNAIFF